MSSGQVTFDTDGPVAIITLDRPQALNALTVDMLSQLAAAFGDAAADDSIRAIVLTGAGERAFCTGGDLAELIPRLTAGELSILVPDASKRFFSDIFKPIIAAVNGVCVGGGLEMLLGTDLRLATPSAAFGLPEVRWGLIAGGGSHVRLPQQVPWAIAMQMLLTGEPISAQRAQSNDQNLWIPGGRAFPEDDLQGIRILIKTSVGALAGRHARAHGSRQQRRLQRDPQCGRCGPVVARPDRPRRCPADAGRGVAGRGRRLCSPVCR